MGYAYARHFRGASVRRLLCILIRAAALFHHCHISTRERLDIACRRVTRPAVAAPIGHADLRKQSFLLWSLRFGSALNRQHGVAFVVIS